MDGGDCVGTEGHYFDYADYIDFHYFDTEPPNITTTPSCFDCDGKDCRGNQNWLGDGTCDTSDCKLCNNFNCPAFNYDFGDCGGPTTDDGSTTTRPPLRSYYEEYSYYDGDRCDHDRVDTRAHNATDFD